MFTARFLPPVLPFIAASVRGLLYLMGSMMRPAVFRIAGRVIFLYQRGNPDQNMTNLPHTFGRVIAKSTNAIHPFIAGGSKKTPTKDFSSPMCVVQQLI